MDSRTNKQYKRKIKINVIKFQKPFKLFRIGKTNLNPFLESKSNNSKLKLPIGKAFINIKLNKDWKININGLSLYGEYKKKNDMIYRYPANQKIFNFSGKSVKWDGFIASFKNTKTDLCIEWQFSF